MEGGGGESSKCIGFTSERRNQARPPFGAAEASTLLSCVRVVFVPYEKGVFALIRVRRGFI